VNGVSTTSTLTLHGFITLNHDLMPEDTESTPLLHPSSASTISTSTTSSSPPANNRLATSFRRPSFVTGTAGRGLLLSSSPIPESELRDDEAFDLIREERGLLKRSSVSFPRARRGSVASRVVERVEETWEDAIREGKVSTSWRYELGVMTRYSVCSSTICGWICFICFFGQNLIVGAIGGYLLYSIVMQGGLMVVLQQSLALASVLSLGHLGTTELGGISPICISYNLASALATMTACITGTAIFQGITT
jgi:hypothetical protein